MTTEFAAARLKQIEGWVRNLRNSAILGAATSLLAALYTFSQARAMSIDAASAAAQNLDALQLAGLFVTGVYTMAGLWFTVSLMGFGLRAAQLVRDRGTKLRLKPGWAIGGWFVPIGQLIIPFLVLNDIAGVGAGEKESARKRSVLWFWMWWMLLNQVAGYALGDVFAKDLLTQFNGWKLYGASLAFNIVPFMLGRRVFTEILGDLRGGGSATQ